jgi:hypothetical protein
MNEQELSLQETSQEEKTKKLYPYDVLSFKMKKANNQRYKKLIEMSGKTKTQLFYEGLELLYAKYNIPEIIQEHTNENIN